MTPQTTRDLLMIEPAEFYFNPQTQETNIYQHDDHESHEVVQERALREFRDFRDCLVENGVRVTTFKGVPECPDHIFPNWASTHPDGTLNLYPMLNENRRAERLPHMVDYLKKRYTLANDFRDFEHNVHIFSKKCKNRLTLRPIGSSQNGFLDTPVQGELEHD